MTTPTAQVSRNRRLARDRQGELVDFRERQRTADPARAARVAALAQAVREGRYQPDPTRLAQILIPVLGL